VSSHTDTQERLTELGVAWRLRQGAGAALRNPHATCAAVRKKAIVEALAECGDRVVVDYYSSSRTGGVVSYLNRKSWDRVRLIQYFPQVVSGDLVRGVNANYPHCDDWGAMALWGDYDDVLMTDVYADIRLGVDFSPLVVADLLPRQGMRMFWIGWCFEDPMGVGFSEASYLIQGDKVAFKPDGGTSGYQLHDRCRWIWNNRAPIHTPGGTISWTIKRNWGQYYIVKFENVGMMPIIQVPPILPQRFIEVKVEEPDTLKRFLWAHVADYNWIRALLEYLVGAPRDINIFIPASLWSVLSAFQQRGSYSQMSLAALENQVGTQLQNNPDMVILFERYPRELKLYQTKLVAVLSVYSAKERVEHMEYITAYNPFYLSYNTMRSSIGRNEGVVQPVARHFGENVITYVTVFVAGVMFRKVVTKVIDSVQLVATRILGGSIDTAAMAKKKKNVVVTPAVPVGPVPPPDAPEDPWNWKKGLWEDIVLMIYIPMVEEIIKEVLAYIGLGHEMAGIVFAIYEYAITTRGGSWSHRLLRLLPFCMHCFNGCFPNMIKRACLHAIWNTGWGGLFTWYLIVFRLDVISINEVDDFLNFTYGFVGVTILIRLFYRMLFSWGVKSSPKAASAQMIVPYAVFRDNFYFKAWSERRAWEMSVGVTQFPEHMALTPTQHESMFEPKSQNKKFKLISYHEEPGWQPSFSAMYWLIPTNVHGYVPSRSDKNMLAMVTARIMAKPPLDAEEQAEVWRNLPPLFNDVPSHHPIVRESHVEQWLEHMESSKRKKYRKYLSELETLPYYYIQKALRSCKLQVKCDELLIKGEMGGLSLKPRAIVNVNPLIQALIGPAIYEATERLKKLWNVENPYVLESMSFAFGSSGTDLQLTIWMEWTLTRPHLWHILVAGDDMLLLNHEKSRYIEGDASMFDQSQATGPLEVEHLLLAKLGLDQETIEVSLQASKANYVGYSGDKTGKLLLTVDKKGVATRASGHCDTTVGNSIVMAVSTRLALTYSNQTLKGLESVYAYLGLKMKLKEFSSLFEITFLKGMWYPADSPSGFYWGPLPSRILKVGKSLKDPRSLYDVKDLAKAAEWFLGDVAKGYSYFMEVPVLRAFTRKHKDKAFGKTLLELEPRLKYKINAAKTPKPNVTSFEYFYKRYDTDPQELEEVEELYPETPFKFIQHPLLEKLVLDYS